MSEATVMGQVHLIEATKSFGQKGFRKRTVVLEQVTGRFTNYLPLATAGQSENAVSMDESERTRLRQQGLDWMRADLNLRRRQLKSDLSADWAMALTALRDWQNNKDLGSIREPAALAQMLADEQQSFTRFWAEVEALLKETDETRATRKNKQ